MSAAPPGPLNVFISYAHEDDGLCGKLLKHLSQLQREGVQGWYDRRLTGGTEWAGEIDEHLNTADIILLLISPDFLASRSEEHTSELQSLRHLGCRLLL